MFIFRKPNLNLFIVICLFMMIAVSPYMDIYISGLFFEYGHFFLKNNLFFNFIDKYFPFVILGISAVISSLWFIGFINSKKWVLRINTKIMLFLNGSLFVGPLLIVNGIFKTFWGRARPRNIIEFGGDKIFSPAMVISNQCSFDCSFVSGHTAVGFWLICFALLFPKKYRNIAILISFIFACSVGLARIAQGYHFFSDVLFSAVITSYTIWFMYYYIVEKNSRF